MVNMVAVNDFHNQKHTLEAHVRVLVKWNNEYVFAVTTIEL